MPPVNLNGIFASYSSIDWRSGLLTYVKTFIQRKPEGRRLLNSTFTHHLSIDRKSSFPAFADASAVVVEQDRFAEMVGSKKRGYVRRTECRMNGGARTKAAFSNAPAREKCESSAGLSKSIAAFWTSLALWKTGKTNESALRIVKSLAVTSVRERSSGNSAATIPHNSRVTNAVMSILTAIIRRDIL